MLRLFLCESESATNTERQIWNRVITHRVTTVSMTRFLVICNLIDFIQVEAVRTLQ